MKTLKIVVTAALLSISVMGMAHQNHDELKNLEISQSEAIVIAMDTVSKKVETKELEDAWGLVESKTAALDRINGRQVWKVSLSKAAGSEPETMNVFISKTGVFISMSK